MAVSQIKTSLSAGEIIRELLLKNEAVASKVTKIFPVVEDSAKRPYIVYRRVRFSGVALKTPTPRTAADEVEIEINCYTENYPEGVELAEAVRDTLDGASGTTDDGRTIRSCIMTDAGEGWEDDAYLQQLVFTIKL